MRNLVDKAVNGATSCCRLSAPHHRGRGQSALSLYSGNVSRPSRAAVEATPGPMSSSVRRRAELVARSLSRGLALLVFARWSGLGLPACPMATFRAMASHGHGRRARRLHRRGRLSGPRRAQRAARKLGLPSPGRRHARSAIGPGEGDAGRTRPASGSGPRLPGAPDSKSATSWPKLRLRLTVTSTQATPVVKLI